MHQWRWDRYGNDRWYDGWYQSPSGLWRHPDWRWSGWGRPPWYPRDRKAVLDANGNRVDPVAAVAAGEDVEWEATMQKWGDAAMGGDDDRSGLFDHSLMSQNEVIADAEEEGNRGAESDAEEEGNREDADDEDAAPWRYLAVEYNRCDDEEAEAGDNVAGATEAEDHDSWTTEQSRDAAESLDAESLSGAGSFILEPPRRRGRAREEPLEHQRWGRAPRDSREQDDESDASGEETDARQLERFEQLAGRMLEMWNGGQLLHTHGGGLTPLVQASDTDLHQAASPPPSGSVPATKAEPPARRVRFEDEPHAVPVPSTPPSRAHTPRTSPVPSSPPSPAPSPTPSPTRRWPTAPPKGMAAVAARPDPSCLPPHT